MFLHYFNKIKNAILEINFLNFINKNVFSYYNKNEILYFIIFYKKNIISIKYNY